jgi:hypothetical protein
MLRATARCGVLDLRHECNAAQVKTARLTARRSIGANIIHPCGVIFAHESMFWHPIESTAVRQGYAAKGERRVFMENGTPGIWASGFWHSYLELNQEATED